MDEVGVKCWKVFVNITHHDEYNKILLQTLCSLLRNQFIRGDIHRMQNTTKHVVL